MTGTSDDRQTPLVSVLIPAYNESDVVGTTVQAALAIPGVSEVIVIDDGSSDGSADAACEAGADRVITLSPNVGKGGALDAGFVRSRGEIVLLLDADLGPSASEGAALLAPVLSGEADMCIAVFGRSREATHSGLAARSGGFGTVVRVARGGIRLLTGRTMEAPLSGQRAVRREVIECAGGFAGRFGVEVGLTIDALRAGYRVMETSVSMVHRASGRDARGFAHRGRQMADMLVTLAGRAFRRRGRR